MSSYEQQQLEAAIDRLPDEYGIPRNVCKNLIAQGELKALRDYTCGLSDMAYLLTSEESLLGPLRVIRALLR